MSTNLTFLLIDTAQGLHTPAANPTDTYGRKQGKPKRIPAIHSSTRKSKFVRLRKTVTPTAKVYISALDCLGLAHLVCRCAFYKKGTSSQLAHVLSTSYMSSQDVMMKYRRFYTFPDDSLTPSKLQQPMACPLPQLDNVSSEAVRCFPFCAARSLPLARTSHSIKYAGIASAKFYSKDCHSQEPFEKVSPPANWGWPCLAIKAALTWFGCEI